MLYNAEGDITTNSNYCSLKQYKYNLAYYDPICGFHLTNKVFLFFPLLTTDFFDQIVRSLATTTSAAGIIFNVARPTSFIVTGADPLMPIS